MNIYDALNQHPTAFDQRAFNSSVTKQVTTIYKQLASANSGADELMPAVVDYFKNILASKIPKLPKLHRFNTISSYQRHVWQKKMEKLQNNLNDCVDNMSIEEADENAYILTTGLMGIGFALQEIQQENEAKQKQAPSQTPPRQEPLLPHRTAAESSPRVSYTSKAPSTQPQPTTASTGKATATPKKFKQSLAHSQYSASRKEQQTKTKRTRLILGGILTITLAVCSIILTHGASTPLSVKMFHVGIALIASSLLTATASTISTYAPSFFANRFFRSMINKKASSYELSNRSESSISKADKASTSIDEKKRHSLQGG